MKPLFNRFLLAIFLLSLSCFYTTTVLADDTADATGAPKFETTLTDKVNGDDPVGEKDNFTKMTPVIYLIAVSDAVKKGQNIKAVWIAEDTKNVAPPNYKIDEKGIAVDKDLDGGQWTGNFSLSKPNAGWPLGQYHVDLYVDNKIVKTIKFTISDKEEATES